MTANEKEKEKESAFSKEPWHAYLEEEIASCGEGTFECDLDNIMKDFLMSTSDPAAPDTALRIDTYYWKIYLPSDPLMKFKEDKGIAGFLYYLYELVFDMARLVPYYDPKQDMRVQLILELRKLPAKTFKIWNEDCLVYTNEPVYTVVMEDNWNGNDVSDSKEDFNGPVTKEFKRVCDEWVNFSAFLARCIESGLDDHYENRCKYPGYDIPEGLEKYLQPGYKKDCRVMVAAQYILLAGRAIFEAFVKKPTKGSNSEKWGLEKWKLWASKFKEIAREYDREYEGEDKRALAAITTKAYEEMVSFYPELFRAPNGKALLK